MPLLLDTDIAIHLRDGSPSIIARLRSMTEVAALAMPTLIELQDGLAAEPAVAEHRKIGTARLRRTYSVHDLDEAVAERYGHIVRELGYARTRVFDRLIAATALVHDLTLVTINGPDFRDIPDLKLEVWPSPGQ